MEKAEHIAVENIGKKLKSEFEEFKKAGLNTIQLPDPEATRFSKMANDALMELVLKKSPEEAKRLKELITK